MTMTDMRRQAHRNDLYIRSEELSGTPAVDPEGAQDIENNADTLVRQLLIEEKRRAAPDRLPEIAPQEEVLSCDSGTPPRREPARESIAQILKAERAPTSGEATPRRRWLRLPRLRRPHVGVPRPTLPRRTVTEARQDAPVPSRARARWHLPKWLRTYRPTRKHVAWAVIAGLVVYRPLMVPLVALLLVRLEVV